VKSVQQANDGMTMWELIKSGGGLMYVLGALSIVGLALIIYSFMVININKLAPRDFGDEVIKKLEMGKLHDAEKMCMSESNIFSKITMAGLDKREKGPIFARESMENCLKNEINDLWQVIGYLADIATIAPLVGLLGTIVGMIQAFNGIAFQNAMVKPMLIAAGVSKAMVTTAAGLFIAIPAQVLFSYFKGKVQQISNVVETLGSDIIKIIEGL
jgi:biopolymer transport protein ExbB